LTIFYSPIPNLKLAKTYLLCATTNKIFIKSWLCKKIHFEITKTLRDRVGQSESPSTTHVNGWMDGWMDGSRQYKIYCWSLVPFVTIVDSFDLLINFILHYISCVVNVKPPKITN